MDESNAKKKSQNNSDDILADVNVNDNVPNNENEKRSVRGGGKGRCGDSWKMTSRRVSEKESRKRKI